MIKCNCPTPTRLLQTDTPPEDGQILVWSESEQDWVPYTIPSPPEPEPAGDVSRLTTRYWTHPYGDEVRELVAASGTDEDGLHQITPAGITHEVNPTTPMYTHIKNLQENDCTITVEGDVTLPQTGLTPGPHAPTHAVGGSDPLTAEDIGAAVATSRVPSNNANDIAATGFYTTNLSQNCPYSNNHPQRWWNILHGRSTREGNDWDIQMASYFFNTGLWFRQCYNRDWQPWQELYHTGNLSPVSLDDFTAWQTMGLINGWGLSGTYPPEYKPAYRKTPFGTVELRGRTRYSHLPTQPTTGHFATLPSGYRPAKKVSLAGSDGDIHIYPGGECYIQQDGGSYPLGVYLDGLFFSTDPEV